MKSQKGVTMISLTIYIITMAIVVGILSTVTTFFYKNVKDTNVDIDLLTEFTTFNSYFSEEINNSNLQVIECGTTDRNQNYIVFSNGVQYTYVPENKGIYRNQVKICRNIDICTFSEKIENGKSVITVNLTAGNQQRETEYTLTN